MCRNERLGYHTTKEAWFIGWPEFVDKLETTPLTMVFPDYVWNSEEDRSDEKKHPKDAKEARAQHAYEYIESHFVREYVQEHGSTNHLAYRLIKARQQQQQQQEQQQNENEKEKEIKLMMHEFLLRVWGPPPMPTLLPY